MRLNWAKLLIIVFTIFVSCSPELIGPKKIEINIVPRPVSVNILEGNFVINRNTVLVVATPDAELDLIAEKLIKKINAVSNFELTISQNIPANGRTIILGFDELEKNLGDEGYQLRILPTRIEIKARKSAGVFYGMQSLFQLLPKEIEDTNSRRDEWQTPCVEILDYPRFQWRGQLLDVSRHFHPVEQIKRNLDHLALLKMNRFHWHLTDDQGWRIEIKSLPKLTEIGAWRVDHNDKEWWQREFPKPDEKATYGGFYTQEEIKDIIKYAQERYITIIPEIDMPGHSRAFMAAYPEVSCDGGPYFVASGGDERNKDLCPGKEITFELVEKIIAEVTALFPTQYYHIGGDECRKHAWEKCPDCQKRLQAEGLKDYNELQSYFIQRVEKLINAHGKAMIGWDEILEGGLAPNATVMSWRGEVGGIKSVQMGHDVIMTPNSYCYLDLKQGDPAFEPDLGYSQLLLPTVYSYNPVPSNFTAEQTKQILGIQGNLWSESIQNENDANYMLFPRLFAIAEVGWSPQKLKNWQDFIHRTEMLYKRFDILGINYARSAYNVWVQSYYDKHLKKIAFKLETEAGTADIKYTLDGSDPGEFSNTYTVPLTLNKSATIKARAFLDHKPFGKITETTIPIHKAFSKMVQLTVEPSSEYNPGDIGLTDCLRGRANMLHKNWFGFEGDNFEAVINFEELTPINTITVSILEATDDGIFLPAKIQFLYSLDNKTYSPLETFFPVQENRSYRRIKEYSVNTEIMAKYIKIQAQNLGIFPNWHPLAGRKAWFFIDEIIVL